MAVALQKIRNRFKRKAPLPYYAQSFADLTSGTLHLVRAHDELWSDSLADEDMAQAIDSLNLAMVRINAARLQMEGIRPPDPALSHLHTDAIWVARGHDALVKQTLSELEKTARGESAGTGFLRRSMEEALRGHQQRMIRDIAVLRQQHPALARAVPISEQYRLEVLFENIES